jgi:hypothetical protein
MKNTRIRLRPCWSNPPGKCPSRVCRPVPIHLNRTALVSLCIALTAALLGIEPANAQDHDVMNMSVYRENLGCASAGQAILFAGGYESGGHYTDAVDQYDSSTGTWSQANLSLARQLLCGVSVGDLALFAGGWNSNMSGSLSRVDVYDSGTGAWSTAELSRARYSLAGTAVGSKAIFAGGNEAKVNSGSIPSDAVDIYDASTGAWSVASLSVKRRSLAAASVGGEAIFAGGRTKLGEQGSNAPTGRVDIYHEATGAWTTASLSEARYGLAATALGDLALFAGGWSGTGYSSAVDIYDSSTGQWTTASLSVPRAWLAGASVGPYAIFAGGEVGSTQFSDVVDIYDSRDGSWSTSTLAEARSSLCGLSGPTAAYFAGGRSVYPLTYSNVVDVYVPEPATLSLLALGGLAVIRRRGRK